MKSIVVILLLALSLPSSISVQQSYKLRLKLAKGQIVRQTMKINSTVPSGQGKSMNVSVDLTARQVCTAVQGDRFTITTSVEAAKINIPGVDPKVLQQQSEAMKKERATLVMNSLGKVVSGSGGAAGNASVASFPANAVRVGSAWTSETTVPSPLGQVKVKVNSKLLGVEKVGGRDCYKISLSMSGSGSVGITGGGTLWVRAADGMAEKVNLTQDIKMGQGAQAMKMKISLNRL